MNRRTLVNALLLVLVGIATVGIAPQSTAPMQSPNGRDDGDPTIRVNVNVVTVDTAVMSKKTGRAIEPLTPQDSVVYEANVPQRIAYFSQDELPLWVVLLFDLTDS